MIVLEREFFCPQRIPVVDNLLKTKFDRRNRRHKNNRRFNFRLGNTHIRKLCCTSSGFNFPSVNTKSNNKYYCPENYEKGSGFSKKNFIIKRSDFLSFLSCPRRVPVVGKQLQF